MRIVGAMEGGEVAAGDGEAIMPQPGLDLGDLGTAILHRAGEGVAERMHRTGTESPFTDIGDGLDAERLAPAPVARAAHPDRRIGRRPFL